MKFRINRLFGNTVFRYAFGVGTVAAAFVIRNWLVPWTGTGAPFESLTQGPAHLQAFLATGIRSFVAVPLVRRGQALGALFLGSATASHVIGQGDLRLAEALADRAAVAIENARLSIARRSTPRACAIRCWASSRMICGIRCPRS